MLFILDLTLFLGLNCALLAIASHELNRYGIGAGLFSLASIMSLFGWSVAEAVVQTSQGYERLPYAIVMGAIGVSAVTDRAAGYVLDVITLPSCSFAMIAGACGARGVDCVLGALAAGGAMLSLYMGSRGRGLGLGDVKLAALIGALLGLRSGLVSLAVSFVFGGFIAALLILCGRASRKTAVPFAPYIAAGALATVGFVPA